MGTPLVFPIIRELTLFLKDFLVEDQNNIGFDCPLIQILMS